MNRNKITRIVAVAVFFLTAFSTTAFAQKPTKTDSIAKAVRLNTLNQRKTSLEDSIKTEDKKRGRTIEGVTPESNERMNATQDSICLALRSKLVDVELEIAELTTNPQMQNIIQLYNDHINSNHLKDKSSPANAKKEEE
ncbi:MAG: hypothetical protein LUC91_07635 [Prevotella sp.]|nr:hypothetical protein [Prevotella sp.]